MLSDCIHKLATDRTSLTREEARAVMAEILAGNATEAQIAALLVALHMKGESVEEIVGFAEAIRAAATPLPAPGENDPPASTETTDTCGTGGDARGTFNISTAAALVAAGAGIRIAKHGNRSVTSLCGSADVIEALGVNLDLPAARLAACLGEVGIAFLYAPAMHAAMRHVQPVRQQLRLRTVFNLLGPLTNPAGASAQVVGVYSEELVPKLAAALQMLGLKRALVVHGSDGLDEITINAETKICELRDGTLRTYTVSPEQFGLQRAPLSAISGGDAAQNVDIIREILVGKKSARRDVVLLNAAAALVAAARASSIAEALPLAAASLDSGNAKKKLDDLVNFTNSLR